MQQGDAPAGQITKIQVCPGETLQVVLSNAPTFPLDALTQLMLYGAQASIFKEFGEFFLIGSWGWKPPSTSRAEH